MAWPKHSTGIWLRGLLWGLAVAAAFHFGLFEGAERWGLNALFHLRGPVAPKSPIVIVSIDEDSFDELNIPWPWPRSLHGQLLDTVNQGNPAVIGFDVLFSEPSLYGAEDDSALADSVRRAGNVILASARTQTLTDLGDLIVEKEDLNPPIPMVRRSAAGFGPVNFSYDDDAFVRWTNLTPIFQRTEWPHFNLLLYRKAIEAGIQGHPVRESRFVINYRGGPRSFPTVPYYRVLNGEVPPEAFAGKIVLVGPTTPVLQDVHPTPFAPQGMPGVEIHANALETVLQGIPIMPVHGAITVLFIFAAGVLAVWLTNRLRPLQAFGVMLMAAALSGAAGFGAFLWGHLWTDLTPIPTALGLGFGATVVENFILVQREKRRLSPFFSPAVLREILRQREGQPLLASRRRITVLFSDIRGFTTLSTKLQPEEVAEFLREYLTALTEAVFLHGGTVDKYIGDCIMALYNAPFEEPDHAARAVHTALEFQKRTRELSARWEAKLGMPLKNGVGINTGDAVVGTMGARQRLEYTAIGDTVNLASRLESITKEFGTPIIISESTYREVQTRFRTRWLGNVTVKGREAIPTAIYGVLEAAEEEVRREVRIPVEAAVMITEGELSVLASLSDLSRGGISVHDLPREFGMGEIEQLRFQLPASDRPINAMGRVAWSAKDKAGFRFIELEPAAQAEIEEFVTRQR